MLPSGILMSVVVLDFETASASDLKKEGAWKYAENPTTEIICLGYSTDGAGYWMRPADELSFEYHKGLDTELYKAVLDPTVTFVAHSAQFEKAIWRNIMVKQYGWPNLPNSRWHDTQAVCAMKAIPIKLERAAMAMRLSEQTGKGHTRIVTAPSKPRKDGSYDRSPELLGQVYSENLQDVRCEVELCNRVGGLQSSERNVWLLDQRINERGVLVDLEFVSKCQRIIDGASVPLVSKFV
jgi:DNA polymerase